MEKIQLKQITVDDVYVSVLDAQIVTDADGKMFWQANNRQLKPTGSFVMDAIARVFAQDIRTQPADIAKAMGRPLRQLGTVFLFLTGKSMREFINEYRLRMICEWLSCTDLPLHEIVTRTGLCTLPALSRFFTDRMKDTPLQYRKKYRPANFRERYRWK